MTRVWTARTGWPGETLVVTRFPAHPLGQVFAPSAELVVTTIERTRGAMGEAQWEAYAAAYLAELRASYRTSRWAWDEVLAMDEVTLACVCADPQACHRTLLAGILGKLGAQVMGERGAEEAAA